MFFSARGVVGPLFRQVHGAIQQHLEAGSTVAEMNAHHTVVDLSTAAIPLATRGHGVVAALGCARLVHTTDRLRVGMLSGHHLLASISELLFIPLDRLQKAL